MTAPQKPVIVSLKCRQHLHISAPGTVTHRIGASLYSAQLCRIVQLVFASAFWKLDGKHVLFAQGFHCTGMPIKVRIVQSSRLMREYEACMILKYCIPCSTLYGDSEHRVLTRRPVQTNWIKKSQNSVSLLCFPQIPSLHQRLSR
jgi:hypothetical protein